MSGLTTTHMIEAYNQEASPVMFFSEMFRSPAQNFHSSEEIEIDITRSEEDVSIVIEDLTTGYRYNSTDLYTSKGFKPPIHKEAIALNSTDLLKRVAGQNPFQSPDFRANVILKMLAGMRKIEMKIRRAIELQASQVLQTGIVTLIDTNGTALYTLNYAPKATHFPTVANSWSGANATIVSDIMSLGNVIRNDGLADVDEAIFGETAFENAMKNDEFAARFNGRRADLGYISPMQRKNNGGIYRGVIDVGNYKYDVWTYGGRYKHPQSGVVTQYMDPNKVVLRASTGRLDASFGAIPNIGALLGGTGGRIPELPARFSNSEGGMDLFTNTWLSTDGEQLFGGVGTRPLMVPTAIDTFGCINTVAA